MLHYDKRKKMADTIEASHMEEPEEGIIEIDILESEPAGEEFYEEITVLVEDWDPKTTEGKKYHQQLKKAHTKEAKKQGYDAREDESLGERTGAEDTKTQSEASRRDESYGDWGTRQ